MDILRDLVDWIDYRLDQPIRRVFGYQLRDQKGKPMTVGQICGAGLAGAVVFLTAYFMLAEGPGSF